MNPKLKNFLAVIAGLILGGLLNSTIVKMSGHFVPLPEGIDPNNLESIKANMHLYEMKHFLMPFIAHALGSLVAGFTTAKLALSKHLSLAMFSGGFFVIGGILMAIMLPAPVWFEALDIIVAFVPMGWLGGKLALLKK